MRAVSVGTVVAGGTASTSLIPDGTDRIRPIAAPAMNTMTTPSAEKKPSCSMIRMKRRELAGVPPMVTLLFHSGLRVVPRANQAPAAAASSAPNSATCLPVAIMSKMPPRNTAAPGRISSHSRAVS